MEQEYHRLDREAMLADRAAVAERVRREVDAEVEAAAEKRRAFFDWWIASLSRDAPAQPTDETGGPLPIPGSRAEDLLEASRAEIEREQAALAEMQKRRTQADREAEEILAAARAEASRVEAEAEAHRAQVEREEGELRARSLEADRIVSATEEERRRVRELLEGAVASLDADAAASTTFELLHENDDADDHR